MKVAVIGAGPGGLVSAKYCVAEGYSVDVFEQNGDIGGLWVYSDCVDFDENGLPLQAALYKGLRTTIPKELMEYSDFPYPKEMQACYLNATEVLEYFNNYADKFNLRPLVKLRTRVTEVSPLEGERWSVKAENLVDHSVLCGTYDAIIIANGHSEEKVIPNIPGKETFPGTQLHSKDFRKTKIFQDKKCLVIGMGVSGQDITKMLLAVTDKVFASYRMEKKLSNLPQNLIEKPCVSRIQGNQVFFEDGTAEEIDVIIYSTGYDYYFPFLTKECGIVVESGKWVRPLYKEIVNIEHPTMCFIGLQYNIPVIGLFDLQARFFVSTLNGHFPLPSKSAMYEDYEKQIANKRNLGIPIKHTHGMMTKELRKEYYEDVAATANIARLPPVIINIFEKILEYRSKGEYRHIFFKVVSDSKYRMIINGEKEFKPIVNDNKLNNSNIINGRHL
ncbi:dimethylaniline monooxygenase [N-oxide-forming] 3-like [Agrilus planipennis]|uniref:Flavin-containing monooxygenase n=1 Tax=Agrilus planipennis TaxID=224129 RepID=A0A1W4XIE7_AGRPL|nr:dimethylaniline monooxygenase [N-oxide-forming] 3-like [Agrilus planipennis]